MLTFGDAAAVKAYNRVRRLITHSILVEFATASWSYYNDTSMVEPAATAYNACFIFLKLHQLLSIPIKGNPLTAIGKGPSSEDRYRPPQGSNVLLGELAKVESLPCSAQPTQSRKVKSVALFNAVRAKGHLHESMASSLMGKIRCLGDGLRGRVGIPALQALGSSQRRNAPSHFKTLCSSFNWLEDIIEHAGPRTWPYSSEPVHSVHVLGDASEPADDPPRIGAVLAFVGQPLRVFEVVVPRIIIVSLPDQGKHIFFYEMLWPVAAAFVWRDTLLCSHPTFHEDNEGANFALLKGFSSNSAASVLLGAVLGCSSSVALSALAVKSGIRRQSSRLPHEGRGLPRTSGACCLGGYRSFASRGGAS